MTSWGFPTRSDIRNRIKRTSMAGSWPVWPSCLIWSNRDPTTINLCLLGHLLLLNVKVYLDVVAIVEHGYAMVKTLDIHSYKQLYVVAMVSSLTSPWQCYKNVWWTCWLLSNGFCLDIGKYAWPRKALHTVTMFYISITNMRDWSEI